MLSENSTYYYIQSEKIGQSFQTQDCPLVCVQMEMSEQEEAQRKTWGGAGDLRDRAIQLAFLYSCFTSKVKDQCSQKLGHPHFSNPGCVRLKSFFKKWEVVGRNRPDFFKTH